MTSTDTPIPPDWIAADTTSTPPRIWAMNGTRPQGLVAQSLDDIQRQFPTVPTLLSAHLQAPAASLPCKPLDLPPQPLGQNRFALAAIDTASHRIGRVMAPVRGFLSLNPGWDGVICLTGAQSHWILISAKEIISVQSFLTGDLQTALQSTASLATLSDRPLDDASFLDAVSETMSRPEKLAAHLVSTSSSDHLAGLLIGAELAAARPYWLGQQLAVIGETAPANLYAKALTAQGAPVTRTDEPTMIRAGLATARADLPTR